MQRILIVHDSGLVRSPRDMYLGGLLRGLVECGHQVSLTGAVSDEHLTAAPDGVRVHWIDGFATPSGSGGAAGRTLPDGERSQAKTPDRSTTADRRSGRTSGDDRLVDREFAEQCDRHALALRRVVVREAPDLIIANHLLVGAAAVIRVARLAGVPVLVVCHDTDLERAERSPRLRDLLRPAFAAATCRVALSPTTAVHAARRFGLEATAVTVVPPGVDGDSVGEIGGGYRPTDVALVGDTSVASGAHLVIAAMPDAMNLCPSLGVRLPGRGPDLAAMEQLVRSLDAGDDVGSRGSLCTLGDQSGRTDLVAPALHALFGPGGRRRRTLARGRIARHVEFVGDRPDDWIRVLRKTRLAVLPALTPCPDQLQLLTAAAAGCAIATTPFGSGKDWCRELARCMPELGGKWLIEPSAPVTGLSHVMVNGVRRWQRPLAQRIAFYIRTKYHWRAIGRRLVQEAVAAQRKREPAARRTSSAPYRRWTLASP